jgi:hypothetical protein
MGGIGFSKSAVGSVCESQQDSNPSAPDWRSKPDVAAFGRKPPFESLRPVCGALPSRRYGLTAWAKATKLEGVLFKKRWKCQKTGGCIGSNKQNKIDKNVTNA